MNRTKMGRPPLPKAKRRSVKVSLRVTVALHKAIVAVAKQEGKSVSKYITDALVDSLKGGT